jgi:hypothetical protein
MVNPGLLTTKGLFGKLHAHVCRYAFAEMLVEKLKAEDYPEEKIEEFRALVKEVDDFTAHGADPMMDEFSFLNLPQEARTLLRFINWCVNFNESRKYSFTEKEEQIRFEVDMRRQFGLFG